MTTLTPPKTSFAALMRLAGPIFVANIAIVGSGTIDTIMAGQLGKNHLAAIAVSIAATISVVMGLAGILQSLSPIAGHHYGARNYRAVGEELEQNFWLGGFLCLFGVPLLMYTDLWISLGKVEGEVARMAAEFLFFTALALPACLFARTFISVNAALSRPRITMWVSLVMLALKVPLNGIFMYGWLGFPAMGGSGAGVSFCILNYLAFLCYLAIWKRDAFYRTMHAERIFGPRWALMKEQLHVGIPIGLSTFFEVSSFTLMAIFVARFGSEAVSAHQIVANITSLCYMLPLSIGIASSVLISQCLGARWPAVAYTVLTRTLKVSVASATCIVTILFFARHWLVTLYSSDTGVCAMAASLLIFGCLYHVFDAMQSVSSFALRGYRVTRLPMIIYGVMLWGVGLGGGYMLAFGNPITGEPTASGAPRPQASGSRASRSPAWPSGWAGSSPATTTTRPRRSRRPSRSPEPDDGLRVHGTDKGAGGGSRAFFPARRPCAMIDDQVPPSGVRHVNHPLSQPDFRSRAQPPSRRFARRQPAARRRQALQLRLHLLRMRPQRPAPSRAEDAHA